MAEQGFEVDADGRTHRVTVDRGALQNTFHWLVDGREVASRTTSDDTVVLSHDEHGAVRIRCSKFGAPRQVKWVGGDGAEVVVRTGVGTIDLPPDPGSPAAKRLQSAADHPTRHTLIATVGATAGILVPIAAIAALVWLAQRVPWPDLPDINFPDIPFPDIPSIPWPDIPLPNIDLPDLPGWLGHLKYVIIVLVAVAIARGEIRRERRRRDARREQP